MQKVPFFSLLAFVRSPILLIRAQHPPPPIDMYQCTAPSTPAYGQASENKGPAVKTFDPLQCIDAKDFRSGDGRRWLRFADHQGQRKSTTPPAVSVSCSSYLASTRLGLFTPWADAEGRPLWTLVNKDAPSPDNKSLATTPLITTVNGPIGREDEAGCAMRGCRQRAHSKCERCSRLICIRHYVKYRSGYRSYDYCPSCADRTRRLLFLVLAVAVVAAIAGGLALYFNSR
nr:hypothetical protein [Pandoravirus belohorizontensis]